ncbi:cation:proton antiporter [Actinomadura macrotermitis]|uniref:Na(+)/H(+)-K(+) antiporter GerN n=1 Tax=Actinomadura macrotermitis TaxID=2585200 RepID=A0A7K0BPC5_9ACTN|nr:cation:proton antiporter [Actinomadura macrotermitis]MQY03021.1 Na(+)/H(+)-K(+) antiporter GerN [Actinomadura macrotermitis]
MAPPLPAHELLVFLLQVGVLLCLAHLLGRIAARFGLPAIVGELLAGVLLGPSLFGWLAPGAAGWLLPHRPEQAHLLDALGQIGVLLLVGLTGMEMDLALLRRRKGTALKVSLAGIVVPLLPGIALAYPLVAMLHVRTPDTDVFALFLGVAMCVSAIPVIAKTLLDMNLIHRDVGQLTLASGMVDDAFGWFMLSVVSAMAVGGMTAGKAGTALLHLLLVVVAAVAAGRPLAGLLLRRAGGSDAAHVTITVILLLLSAAATQALGLEAVFGAFVGGMVIGTRPGFDRSRLAGLRSLVLAFLAPVFFATAGLRIDLRALSHPAVLGAALLVLTTAVAGKFAGAYLGGRLSRLTRWESLALGAGMNARGVIEVIVAMVGLRLGILDAASYTIIVLVAVVTSLMAPPVLRLTMGRVEHTAAERLRLTDRNGPAAGAQLPGKVTG